jgi:hypothetical protein
MVFLGVETFVEFVSDAELSAWMTKRMPLDCRVLRIKTRHGARCRSWQELCEDIAKQAFAGFPLTGPRTTPFCVEYLNRQPGGAADRHQLWAQLAKVSPSDWGVAEHATILEAIKLAGSYDQMDVSNLASIEVLMRRAQTIEYCYQDRVRENQNTQHQKYGPRLTLEEQSAFMGVSRTDMCMIDPALLSHIKDHVKEDAELAKNLRLAREERTNANKNKKKNGETE